MTEPLVTIELSRYNELINKKTITDTLYDLIFPCKTTDEAKSKIDAVSFKLEAGNIEIHVHLLATIVK